MKLSALINESGASAPEFNKQLESEEEIIAFFERKLDIASSYLTFNDDGTVDVNHDIDFHGLKMDKLPFKFGHVKGYFTINDSKLKTLENMPHTVTGNLNLKGNDFATLHGCPKLVGGSVFIGGCEKISSLEGISEQLGALNIRRCPNLKSLHNIHKYIKKFEYTANVAAREAVEGTIMIGQERESYLEKEVLGIFLIPGINRVKAGIGNISSAFAAYGPWTIINHHLMKGGDKEDAMYDCQEELYKDGFKEFAKV